MRSSLISICPAARLATASLILAILCFVNFHCHPHVSATEQQQQQQVQVPKAADRIRDEPESVWVEFIQLALDHKPLNLGQGFPDFAAPQYLVESLRNATQQTEGSKTNVLNHQYTRSFGHPRLVRALRDYYKQLGGFPKLEDEKEQVLVTVGAYEALFTAVMAFVNPGDEVIIIDPAFDAYAPMVAMAGGKSIFVPLRPQNTSSSSAASAASEISSASYQLDMSELKSKITARTRAIVLNTPNNPIGKIYSFTELKELATLCIEHNLLVIADEVYEQFYYDSYRHLSIAHLPGMWDRTITIGSAGKTFSVTGWKIGWALGPKHLIRYMQLVHQTAVYTVATPLQEALARAFEHERDQVMEVHRQSSDINKQLPSNKTFYWEELRQELQQKRNKMAQILARAQMKAVIPQGGYFMMVDFSNLSKLFPEYNQAGVGSKGDSINTNDYRFARWLSRVKHLQGIPGSAFYSEANKSLGKDLIRLCFIKSTETLNEFERLIDDLVRGSNMTMRQA